MIPFHGKNTQNTLFYFTVAGLNYSETPFVFACLLE